jgi:hypothetical protein
VVTGSMRNRVSRQGIEAARGACDGADGQMQKKRNTEGTEIGALSPQRGYTFGVGAGVPPRGDRKSAEAAENTRDRRLPLRKRVRNSMIMLELQTCDRKEKTWAACLSQHNEVYQNDIYFVKVFPVSGTF